MVACWSVKGGSGTTVVAASLALTIAARSESGVLLVDLAGDAPAALGLPDPSGPGVVGWAAAGCDVPADALARLEVPVLPRVELLPRGDGEAMSVERLELLAAMLASDHRTVVVDCGTVQPWSPAVAVAAGASTSLLVIRPCYLALRRAVAAAIRPSGVVVVAEPGRALERGDIEAVIGAPVRAQIALEPAIARAVDAGLLATRLPRVLQRALRDVA